MKNRSIVNLNSPDEVKKMGKLLAEINIENDTGVDVSVLYYESGIEEFDITLQNSSFYEYGLTFHMSSFENAIAFVLFHPQKRIFVKREIYWRDSIKSAQLLSNPIDRKFISQNLFLNVTKMGALGSSAGLIGSAISMAGGSYVSKLRGVKTRLQPAIVFKLEFEDSNIITLYTKEKNRREVENFIARHFQKSLDNKTIDGTDSRCFIATACYSNLETPALITFRNYRDQYLNRYFFGKLFVYIYYKVSPFLIKFLNKGLKEKIKILFLDRLYQKLYSRYYGRQQ